MMRLKRSMLKEIFGSLRLYEAANGLKLTTNLAEEYYTSPMDGLFTTENIASSLTTRRRDSFKWNHQESSLSLFIFNP